MAVRMAQVRAALQPEEPKYDEAKKLGAAARPPLTKRGAGPQPRRAGPPPVQAGGRAAGPRAPPPPPPAAPPPPRSAAGGQGDLPGGPDRRGRVG